jgi:hypothetical protein
MPKIHRRSKKTYNNIRHLVSAQLDGDAASGKAEHLPELLLVDGVGKL